MNHNNKFYVYDKQKDNIFYASPNSTFFINNLNTLKYPTGELTDELEKAYSIVESKSWQSFDNIRNSSHFSSINLLDKCNLYIFLLFLHWRLPCNLEVLGNLSANFFQGDNQFNFINIVDKNGNNAPKEITDSLRNSEIFKKSTRMILPFTPFHKDKNWWRDIDKWRFLYSGDSKSWNFIGDNPIVTLGLNDHDPINCLKKFICPISGNITLISVNNHLEGTLPPDFSIVFNIAIIQRSKRFVAFHDKGFLMELIKHYKIYTKYRKTETIVEELFNMLE